MQQSLSVRGATDAERKTICDETHQKGKKCSPNERRRAEVGGTGERIEKKLLQIDKTEKDKD